MKKVIFITLCFCFCLLKAQPPTKFYTRFGGNGDDVGNSVIQALDGQYVVAGSTSSFGYGNTDVYLAKVDTMGWVRWERSYGGYNNDIGTKLIQIADSGYVISGYTNSFGSGGYDLLILRTDKNGNLIWQKAFGGMDWDYGYDLKQTADGGFIVCGSTYSYGRGKLDAYIVKVDINGIYQWQKTYGGIEDDGFKSMVFTYNNLIAFGGTTGSYGDSKGDCWLFKTDMNGDSVLSIKYGSNNKQFINDIAEYPTHEFLLCGGDDKNGTDSSYAYTSLVSENGAFLLDYELSYHNLKDAQFYSLTYLKGRQFAYLRKQYNSAGGRKLEPMVMICVPVYDTLNGTTTFGSLNDDDLFDACKTRDKGFICVGYTKGFGASLTDVYLVKLDSNVTSMAGAPSAVGVDELITKNNKLNIFPTVTKDYINVESSEIDNKQKISVLNSIGETVFESNLTGKKTTLNLSTLFEGIYFVRILNKSRLETFKIIKVN